MFTKNQILNRRVSLASLAALLLISLGTVRHAKSDIVYDINPVVLSNGFSLAGGFIETDGTTGAGFTAANITDYAIHITGPTNFSFLPTNAGARIMRFDSDLAVNEHEMSFPGLPEGDHAEIRFESRVRIDPFATFFVQQIFWSQGGSPNQTSQVGFINVSFGGGENQPSNGQGVNSQPMLNQFQVAATSTIPEPGSLGFLGFALIGLAYRRPGRRRST